MTTTAEIGEKSRLANPDARPLVVTIVVVGWLLLGVLGGLNAIGVYASHSLDAHDPQRDARPDWIAAYDPVQANEEREKQKSVDALEQRFAPLFFVAALLGVTGAVALLKRKPWSRFALWSAGALAIGVPVLYQVRLVELHTAEAASAPAGDQAAATVMAFALLNVGIQAIPIAILCALLRHPALRGYLNRAAAESPPAPR